MPAIYLQHLNQIATSFQLYNDLYKQLADSISGASKKLNQRVELLKEYEQACKQTQKSLQQLLKTRQKTSIDNERVDAQLAQLQYQKSLEQSTRDEFEQVSTNVKEQLKSWIKIYEYDLNSSINTFASNQLQSHRLFQDQIILYLSKSN